MSIVLHNLVSLQPPFHFGSEAVSSLWMWERIPEMTRERDYQQARGESDLDEWGRPKGPLRQLLDVLAEGFESIKSDAGNLHSLIDINSCPPEYLPHLSALFGFEFPFDLSVDQQRRYLHTIISMYRTKGTAWTLRLAAMRVIGEGFDLEITNEDYQAKTYDVILTAEGGGSVAPQLEQKLGYMVREFGPAGMVPRTAVVYYFEERVEQRMGDEGETLIEYTSWRFNNKTHRMNDTAVFNDLGSVTITL